MIQTKIGPDSGKPASGGVVDERVRVRPQTFSNIVPRAVLDDINQTIERARKPSTLGLPTGLVVAPDVASAIAESLRKIEAFRAMEDALRQSARQRFFALTGRHATQGPLHIVRCVDRTTRRESHCRHFDSHMLTLLVPLQLADVGHFNGDLLFYQRRRNTPSTPSNIAVKLLHGIQRNLPFGVRRALTVRDLAAGQCERIDCLPGNVYAFDGFVTQHGNLHIEYGERRSLLIHWYDPGMSGGLSLAMRKLRRICDSLRGG